MKGLRAFGHRGSKIIQLGGLKARRLTVNQENVGSNPTLAA